MMLVICLADDVFVLCALADADEVAPPVAPADDEPVGGAFDLAPGAGDAMWPQTREIAGSPIKIPTSPNTFFLMCLIIMLVPMHV